MKCSDGLHRIFYPGIPIHSLDGEEAYCTCGARGAAADHPCPRCLVYKTDLHKVTKKYDMRTSESMQAVYSQAQNASTKTATENILKNNGLHQVKVMCTSFYIILIFADFSLKNAFWYIKNSDPYHASSYDLLHSDELGKFGKHLWPLTLDVLGDLKEKGKFSNKYV